VSPGGHRWTMPLGKKKGNGMTVGVGSLPGSAGQTGAVPARQELEDGNQNIAHSIGQIPSFNRVFFRLVKFPSTR
jgi:hypothetical protein